MSRRVESYADRQLDLQSPVCRLVIRLLCFVSATLAFFCLGCFFLGTFGNSLRLPSVSQTLTMFYVQDQVKKNLKTKI